MVRGGGFPLKSGKNTFKTSVCSAKEKDADSRQIHRVKELNRPKFGQFELILKAGTSKSVKVNVFKMGLKQ